MFSGRYKYKEAEVFNIYRQDLKERFFLAVKPVFFWLKIENLNLDSKPHSCIIFILKFIPARLRLFDV